MYNEARHLAKVNWNVLMQVIAFSVCEELAWSSVTLSFAKYVFYTSEHSVVGFLLIWASSAPSWRLICLWSDHSHLSFQGQLSWHRVLSDRLVIVCLPVKLRFLGFLAEWKRFTLDYSRCLAFTILAIGSSHLSKNALSSLRLPSLLEILVLRFKRVFWLQQNCRLSVTPPPLRSLHRQMHMALSVFGEVGQLIHIVSVFLEVVASLQGPKRWCMESHHFNI